MEPRKTLLPALLEGSESLQVWHDLDYSGIYFFHLTVNLKITAREPECFQVRDQQFLEQILEPRKTLLLLC